MDKNELIKELVTVKVKALLNLKYNKNCFLIGDEFNVNLQDAQEMVDKGYIELLEEIPEEDKAGE